MLHDNKIKIHLFSPFTIKKNNIINHGYIDEKKLLSKLKFFEYGLIFLRDKKTKILNKYSFPSKTFTYVEARLPIIAFCEDESYISALLKQMKLVFV